jgi:hypothetical protein
VSRGVCEVDVNNNLITINERIKIYRNNGKIVYEDIDGIKHEISEDAKASMNFWCFHPTVFSFLEEEFKKFLNQNINDPKSEFLIPQTADQFIRSKKKMIKVLPTNAKWFGVTYKEDAPIVTENIKQLVVDKLYPPKLW